MRMRLVLAATSLVSLSAQVSAQKTRADDVPRPDTCFEGTGGPSGDFDWYVHSGEIFFLDTSSSVILGGPGGARTQSQTVLGGVVDVRDLVIEEGGEIRVQGPNAVRIQASRNVIVRGRLDASGFSGRDVATLNTGNMMELGGTGGPGGGRGGNANVVTTGSTPRGGSGQGPAGFVNAGGQGGETGYTPAEYGKDARRPGGGAGGSFAANGGPGEEAQPGADGHPLSSGAVSGSSPARGGALGDGPFGDATTRNDFFGEAPLLAPSGHPLGRLRGELAGLTGGFGGGGGGNADPSLVFPTPGWNFASDEKGGPGGGGGGVVHIQALGKIVFGAVGEIRANGGRGGVGENTNFLDHIGGSGGSGSGGHVVLEAADEIDFTDGGANRAAQGRDWIQALGGPRTVGPTSFVPAELRGLSNGGAGGPGVVQLHVRDPLRAPGITPSRTDLVVPFPVAVADEPLDAVASPAALGLYLLCTPPPSPLTHIPRPWFAAQRALPAALEPASLRFDPLDLDPLHLFRPGF